MQKASQLSSQQSFIAHIAKLRSLAQQSGLGASLVEKLAAQEQAIRDCELVIPVVGAFSSGKSTMLNMLLGEHILPTAIKPETSLAMELRHGDDPHIEAVAEDGTVSRFAVGDIKAVSDKASSYVYARLYLDSPRLKALEPMVLVDMPGFDAPIERHNKAIMAYLLRGCHYLILCDIQEGTVSQTLLRHMREIESWGREFSLFMSKADLKPRQDVDEILAHVREVLSDNFDFHVAVDSLDNASADKVAGAVSRLNPDALFGKMYVIPLIELCNDVLDALNTRLKAAHKKKEELVAVVEQLKESIRKIREKADADVEVMRQTYSAGLVGDIVTSVGDDLSAACDEIVNAAESGGQAHAEARLNDIVRTALMDAVKDKMGEVNARICQDISASLEGIDRIMKDNQFDDAYVERLSLKIQTAFTAVQDIFAGKGDKAAAVGAALAGGSAFSVGSKAVGGGLVASSLLGVTAGIAMPLIGVALMFLPELLGLFFKNSSKDKVRSALRSKLQGDVFPAVKRKLREALPAHLEEQVGRMIEQVREQYAALIAQKTEELEAAVARQDADKAAQEHEQNALETARGEAGAVLTALCEAKKQWEQNNA